MQQQILEELNCSDSKFPIMSKDHPISPIDPQLDPYGFLGLIKKPDGSVARLPASVPYSPSPANPDPASPDPVLTKDIPINQQTNTWARLYLPRRRLEEAEQIPSSKLPLIVYFHGGGFVIGSVDNPLFHQFCFDIADAIPALVVSVGYRLAPEHRLPSAYEDCTESLFRILSASSDEWLKTYADYSRCFLMGVSAGANIAYHVGLRVAGSAEIRGLILQQPYFGKNGRTPSEVRLKDDNFLPPSVLDLMWELGLPVGADRDHPYSNPRSGIESGSTGLSKMKSQGWIVMVTGCDGDPLIDHVKDFVEMLEEKGIEVLSCFRDGGFHGVELFDESWKRDLIEKVKELVVPQN